MQQNYPEHIYEPIRREVAVSYIRHELRKYLPTLRDEDAWKKIDTDVAGWFDQSPFLLPVRDFWNGFYGIVMGFNLLIHLCDYVTAQNIIWTREQINPRMLTFSGFNPREFGVPTTTMAVEEAIDFYVKPGNQARRVEDQAKLEKTFEKTPSRTDDPIIVIVKKVDEKDQLVIYEGNARVFRAVLDAKNTVEAFVGRHSDEKRTLTNFWVPTSYLLELVHLARAAYRENDETTYQGGVVVLKKILTFSESAKFEMKDRAVHGPSEFKEKILADLLI